MAACASRVDYGWNDARSASEQSLQSSVYPGIGCGRWGNRLYCCVARFMVGYRTACRAGKNHCEFHRHQSGVPPTSPVVSRCIKPGANLRHRARRTLFVGRPCRYPRSGLFSDCAGSPPAAYRAASRPTLRFAGRAFTGAASSFNTGAGSFSPTGFLIDKLLLLEDIFEAWRRQQLPVPFQQCIRIRLLKPLLVARQHHAAV